MRVIESFRANSSSESGRARAERRRKERHEIRDLLRAPVAAALGRGRRARALPGCARAGGAGRPARHRLRLGGRAPLPRGVLAFLGAGGVPGGGLAAVPAHSSRARHRAHAARLQPPGARGGARGHAGPRLRRPRRLGDGRIRVPGRAGRLRHQSGGSARHVAGDGRAGRQHDGDGSLSGVRRPVLLDAGAQRGAEARAEAAPADLGGLLEPRDHSPGGAARHRRAHVRVHRSRRGQALGRGLLRDVQARVRADRPRRQPQHRDGHRVLVPCRRRRGGAARE